jgi:hypothetical protein
VVLLSDKQTAASYARSGRKGKKSFADAVFAGI